MRFPKLTGFAFAAALGAMALAHPALAADGARTITVSGEGEASGVPTIVQLTAGVATVAPTADAALAENARKMTAVFAALTRMGVPERAIQTSNFSVQPQYADNNRGDGNQKIIGYLVSNQVDVRLDDPKKLGPALDALVGAGANQINSVSFSIGDASALETKSREVAIADARKRAETYARAAGVQVGEVMSIQETGSARPQASFRDLQFRVPNAASTPTAAGEMTVTADVTVVFALK